MGRGNERVLRLLWPELFASFRAMTPRQLVLMSNDKAFRARQSFVDLVEAQLGERYRFERLGTHLTPEDFAAERPELDDGSPSRRSLLRRAGGAGWAAEVRGRDFVLRFSRCGSLKTMEFMKWLDISFPRWLENDQRTTPDILRNSVDPVLQFFADRRRAGSSRPRPRRRWSRPSERPSCRPSGACRRSARGREPWTKPGAPATPSPLSRSKARPNGGSERRSPRTCNPQSTSSTTSRSPARRGKA